MCALPRARARERPAVLASVTASWRTSLAGALVLLGVAACLHMHVIDPAAAAMLVPVALGLLAARDGRVTSEQAGAQPVEPAHGGES